MNTTTTIALESEWRELCNRLALAVTEPEQQAIAHELRILEDRTAALIDSQEADNS